MFWKDYWSMKKKNCFKHINKNSSLFTKESSTPLFQKEIELCMVLGLWAEDAIHSQKATLMAADAEVGMQAGTRLSPWALPGSFAVCQRVKFHTARMHGHIRTWGLWIIHENSERVVLCIECIAWRQKSSRKWRWMGESMEERRAELWSACTISCDRRTDGSPDQTLAKREQQGSKKETGNSNNALNRKWTESIKHEIIAPRCATRMQALLLEKTPLKKQQ